MNDPERLLKNPPSPLSLLLLRAGAEEKPSAAALRRTAKAVAAAAVAGAAAKGATAAATVTGTKLAAEGAAPALTAAMTGATAGATAPTSAAPFVGLVAKWVGIGALGGAIAAPLAETVRMQGAERSRTPPALSAAPSQAAPMNRATTRTPRTPELAVSSAPAEGVALTAPEPRPVESFRASSKTPALSEAPRKESALLAEEVRFIDHGRAALQRGASERALELLAPYEERFPHQQLLTEVLFLRMEAFARFGDRERARALAARIIGRGVAGPQAARARDVLTRE